MQPTIKEVGPDGMVVKTLDRSRLWDVQTPQIIRPELLKKGFAKVEAEGLAVTDDVSIIEALGLPVKVTGARGGARIGVTPWAVAQTRPGVPRRADDHG